VVIVGSRVVVVVAERTVVPTRAEEVVAADVGDTVVVRIPDNPTTGYRWDVASSDPRAVDIERATWDAAAERSIGGGAHRVITIRVVAPGSSTVALRCWRPWAGESSVVERMSIVINAT
jgi:inhibitor of cysteine peptidase